MNLSTPDNLAVVDYLLTTTRSVRKRLDLARPVEAEVIEHCIEIAIQAPSGSNRQPWHFVVVTDAAKRAGLADLYRQAFDKYLRGRSQAEPDGRSYAPSASTMRKVTSSAAYLAKHLHEVPVHIIPCIEGRVETSSLFTQASHYGSLLPAVWSLMLALRARGLGSTWTTLHLPYEQEAAQLLGIPSSITQAALLPVAYFTGKDFHPAERIPAREVTHWMGGGREAECFGAPDTERLHFGNRSVYSQASSYWMVCTTNMEQVCIQSHSILILLKQLLHYR